MSLPFGKAAAMDSFLTQDHEKAKKKTLKEVEKAARDAAKVAAEKQQNESQKSSGGLITSAMNSFLESESPHSQSNLNLFSSSSSEKSDKSIKEEAKKLKSKSTNSVNMNGASPISSINSSRIFSKTSALSVFLRVR